MTSLWAFLTRPVNERGLAGFVLYKLRWAINALGALFVVATVGYVVLEHYSLIDGAFMTVITLSTVGYTEVRPLDDLGRLFTMGIIIASFGTLAYAGAVLTSLFTSGEISQHLHDSRGARMRHAIEDHIIVVGFGRVGQAAARGVAEFGRRCVVIERSAARESLITEAGHVPLVGDATSESDLEEAGIHRARALIAAADDDAINLIVTLTARAVRPDLRIVSRVNEATWQDRIERAGASAAQSPYRSYGLSLAASAVTPAVLELHSIGLLGLVTEEIEISGRSDLVGKSLGDLGAEHDGVFVLGRRRDRHFQHWNEVNGVIEASDVLVALGTPVAVGALAARA